MTGAQRLVQALAAAGVRQLFSLSGNQILSVYDATIGRDIELIHTRHEAAAVHMADAWGRLTEQPGVALVTAGPGMLNAVSALYAARMAESPVVLMAGASPRAQRGKGAFQEVDQVAAAKPVVKAAWSLEDPARVGDDVARALAIAASGRPGPVYLSLPNDVMDGDAPGRVGAQAAPRDPDQEGVPGSGLRSNPSAASVASLAERDALAVIALLAEAKRPLILTGPAMGRGPRWASVQRLAAAIGAPALPIESPRGVNDPWLRGATRLLGEADVVLLLGKPLDYSLRFGQAFGRGTRVIALDVEAAASAPGVTLALAADPAPAAERLAAVAATRAWPASSWRDEVESARRAMPPEWQALRRASAPIHPLAVCAALEPHLAAGALLIADGGEFGQWIQAGLEPRERIINGLAGGIGSALPMAIGARRARPERPVIAALGDGTFGFHALELDTAVRHQLPVVVVIGNDARWNAEHTLQLRTYGAERTVGCELLPSRYDQLAAALGCHGELVTRGEELAPALARALAAGKPACVNVLIDGQPAPTFGGGGTRGHA